MADVSGLPKIAAVTTCKGRLAHLKQTLPRLMAQPFHEVVVVDYDCPDRAGDWAENAFPGVKVVRAADKPLFHVAAARNLGAAASRAPWLFFIDADVLLAPDFVETVAPTLRRGAYFLGEPLERETCGTMFVTRTDFETAGGYDETFRNWGGEDLDLVLTLARLGRGRLGFSGELISPIRHDDALRVRHHPLDDRPGSGRRNGLYSLIKQTLAKQGYPLGPEARAKLYEAVCQGVDADPMVNSIEIPLSTERLYGVAMAASLRFQLTQYDDYKRY